MESWSTVQTEKTNSKKEKYSKSEAGLSTELSISF